MGLAVLANENMNTTLLKLKNSVLYGATFRLVRHEQTALDAWRETLSTEGKSLLDSQLKHLTSYQRQAGGKLLCFFPLDHRNFIIPPRTLFPCKLEECVIARIHLYTSDKPQAGNEIKAEIVLHKGKLSFIEFNKLPDKMLAERPYLTEVETLRDPMVPTSENTVSEAQRREEVLKSIQSKLPDEYLQIVREGIGVSINKWAVYAVQDVRKIPQRDGSYYLLAEKEDMGAVGVKEDDFSSQLYYLDYGDDRGEKITLSLRKFLQEFDGGKIAGRF